MKSITVRFDDDVFEEIGKLSHLSGVPKNTVINIAIREMYSKVYDDPQVRRAYEKLEAIRVALQDIDNNFVNK